MNTIKIDIDVQEESMRILDKEICNDIEALNIMARIRKTEF